MPNLKIKVKEGVCLIPVLLNNAVLIPGNKFKIAWEYDPNTIEGAYSDQVVKVYYEDEANSTWVEFPEQFDYTDDNGEIDYSSLIGFYEVLNIRISVSSRICHNLSNTIYLEL